jgi:acetyl-CoA acetyltransferase
MPLRRRTAVIGTAISFPQDDGSRSLEEMLYDITQEVLGDAKLTIEDIDGIVVASNDQLDGRAIAIMQASGPVGGVDRDILATPSASEHALVQAVLRVASGLYETQLIVSWSPTEASSISEALRLGADPYFHRKLPLDELTAAALQASTLLASNPDAQLRADAIAKHSQAQAATAYPDIQPRPVATPPHPLEPGMAAQPITGIVALIIASEDFVASRGYERPAWLRGMGWATEAGLLGDRDLSSAGVLKEAMTQAYNEAGIGSGDAVDLYELTAITPYQQIAIEKILGLARADGPAVNPSGGAIAINPVFCTGLMRAVEAARQVQGKAGPHQVADVRLAVAQAASGFAMTYQSVFVFGADANKGDKS